VDGATSRGARIESVPGDRSRTITAELGGRACLSSLSVLVRKIEGPCIYGAAVPSRQGDSPDPKDSAKGVYGVWGMGSHPSHTMPSPLMPPCIVAQLPIRALIVVDTYPLVGDRPRRGLTPTTTHHHTGVSLGAWCSDGVYVITMIGSILIVNNHPISGSTVPPHHSEQSYAPPMYPGH
jgi:hypothetical protein